MAEKKLVHIVLTWKTEMAPGKIAKATATYSREALGEAFRQRAAFRMAFSKEQGGNPVATGYYDDGSTVVLTDI